MDGEAHPGPYPFEPAAEAADPWLIDEPEPSDLVAPWPGEAAPTLTEIQALVEQATGEPLEVLGEMPGDDPDIQWNAVVRLPGHELPVIVWVEPNQAAASEDPELPPGIAACRWIVGAETVLDVEDPIASYATVVRTLASAIEDAPALLDVNTTRWFTRRELEEFFLSNDLEPPAELLWIIHAVQDGDGADGAVWLHTHGLWRCARPELEMLEVEADAMSVAGEFLNGLAELVLEEGLPAPGEAFGPGVGLEIAVQPWEEVAKYLDDRTPGSTASRREMDDAHEAAHTGVRAAVCAATPQGTLRQIWTAPHDVLRKIRDDGAIVYRTERASSRHAALAQATWPEFAMGFATLKAADRLDYERGGAAFIVKVALEREDDEEGRTEREHVWYEVKRIDGDRFTGTLLSQPVLVEGYAKGDEGAFERADITDWAVATPMGMFEPGRHAGLDDAVEKLRRRD